MTALEKTLRKNVLQILSKDLDAKPVENVAWPGYPDVEYIGGVMELKRIPRWPATDSIVRIPHFSPQQKVFLARRCRKGGKAWLLLQVGKEYFLFEGDSLSGLGKSWTQQDIRECCDIFFFDLNDLRENLIECL
jgi:hypothetical protein